MEFVVILPLLALTAALIIFLLASARSLVLDTFGALWFLASRANLLTRVLLGCVALALLASPVLAYVLYERSAILARIPTPLKASEIEYRLEQDWAADGAGVGWGGLVVYRLDEASLDLVRSEGASLQATLSSGLHDWHATPIDHAEQYAIWHSSETLKLPSGQQPSVADWVGQYGFSVEVDPVVQQAADRAIQAPGSLYAFSGERAITVLDPSDGKVYYFYAPKWPD